MGNMCLRLLLSLLGVLPAFSFGHAVRGRLLSPEEPFPKDYFRMPVNTASVRISGTFGELRSNHFHTGLDISSSTGSIGQPIFAAADGFIDRIRVQESGYGNVLYLKHPNGYTTVYAHLDKFSSAVDKYVKEMQYKRERFEVDLYPPDGTFKVSKGDQIGRMGNSGSSEGPHLHFEIRRTSNQKALNPLLFGLPVVDRLPPELRDMKVYFLSENREVLDSRAFPIVRRKDGSYGVPGDTVRLPAWRVGFGLKTYDQANGNPYNKNGIYSLTVQANDQTVYEWNAAEIDFDESRYLNAHADYSAYQRYGAWFHRGFVLPGNRLSNYSRTESLGAIPLFREAPTKVTLKAVDANENSSAITFWVLRDEVEPAAKPANRIELAYDVDNRIDMDGFSLSIPKGALYETLYFEYLSTPAGEGMFSPVHHAHVKSDPLHSYSTLTIHPENLPENLRDKAVIARLSRGKPVNCGGTWRVDVLETRVRDFGDYCIMVDTTPPTIKPVVFAVDMRRKNTMSFRLNDNFRTDARAKGLRYRGTVDGKWVLFEYDRKRARLTHRFDGRIASGEHTLRLVVTDDRGNEAVYERNFIR